MPVFVNREFLYDPLEDEWRRISSRKKKRGALRKRSPKTDVRIGRERFRLVRGSSVAKVANHSGNEHERVQLAVAATWPVAKQLQKQKKT